MRNKVKFRFGLLLLLLPLLSDCTGNIGAAVPLGAALASCSREANPASMVPQQLAAPAAGWNYRISEVRVIAPAKRTIPPPIMPASFRAALMQAVRVSGLLAKHDSSQFPRYSLQARIVSQQRKGTFSSTRLKLEVDYSLIPQNGPANGMRTATITTEGEIHDWRTDACARLRQLQEQLVRKSIERIFAGFLPGPS